MGSCAPQPGSDPACCHQGGPRYSGEYPKQPKINKNFLKLLLLKICYEKSSITDSAMLQSLEVYLYIVLY